SDRDIVVDLELQAPGGTITIQAGESNNAGGARIEEALVTLYDDDDEIAASGLTDADGNFTTPFFRTATFRFVVDGTDVGFDIITGEVGTPTTGNYLKGVVLTK